MENPLEISGIAQDKVLKAIEQYNTPLFMYSANKIREKYNKLKENFSDELHLYYSIKANPLKKIINVLKDLESGFEVCSGGELELLKACNCNLDNIIFCGPGKTNEEIKIAIESNVGAISIESVNELKRLIKLSNDLNKKAQIIFRVNPQVGVKNAALQMSGTSQFGMDKDNIEKAFDVLKNTNGVEWLGFHCYMGTQILSEEQIINNTEICLDLILNFAVKMNKKIKIADIGGGLGIPYYDSQKQLNLKLLSEQIIMIIKKYRSEYPENFGSAKVIMELGRFLVAESGIYISNIVDVKTNNTKKFLVLDGGINHFLPAAAIGRIVRRDFPMGIITKKISNSSNIEQESVTVVGPLCTPLDTIAKNMELKKCDIGDFVVIPNTGAYGFSGSPLMWLSHKSPAEVLIDDNEIILARNKGNYSNIINNNQL